MASENFFDYFENIENFLNEKIDDQLERETSNLSTKQDEKNTKNQALQKYDEENKVELDELKAKRIELKKKPIKNKEDIENNQASIDKIIQVSSTIKGEIRAIKNEIKKIQKKIKDLETLKREKPVVGVLKEIKTNDVKREAVKILKTKFPSKDNDNEIKRNWRDIVSTGLNTYPLDIDNQDTWNERYDYINEYSMLTFQKCSYLSVLKNIKYYIEGGMIDNLMSNESKLFETLKGIKTAKGFFQSDIFKHFVLYSFIESVVGSKRSKIDRDISIYKELFDRYAMYTQYTF